MSDRYKTLLLVCVYMKLFMIQCNIQDSNDNGVRLVNFVTSKNLVVMSTMFPHRNIHCTAHPILCG